MLVLMICTLMIRWADRDLGTHGRAPATVSWGAISRGAYRGSPGRATKVPSAPNARLDPPVSACNRCRAPVVMAESRDAPTGGGGGPLTGLVCASWEHPRVRWCDDYCCRLTQWTQCNTREAWGSSGWPRVGPAGIASSVSKSSLKKKVFFRP